MERGGRKRPSKKFLPATYSNTKKTYRRRALWQVHAPSRAHPLGDVGGQLQQLGREGEAPEREGPRCHRAGQQRSGVRRCGSQLSFLVFAAAVGRGSEMRSIILAVCSGKCVVRRGLERRHLASASERIENDSGAEKAKMYQAPQIHSRFLCFSLARIKSIEQSSALSPLPFYPQRALCSAFFLN